MGLKLDTIAAIGVWADIRTLKHYLGQATLARRVSSEINGGYDQIKELLTASLRNAVADLSRSDAGSPHLLVAFRMRRRPWRWHKVSPSGNSTLCGDAYNSSTMSLCFWSTHTEEPLCRLCCPSRD